MYTKTIDGKQVINACKVIQLADGSWVSNPTEEMILAEGWEEYTPIINEPRMEDRQTADYQQMLAESQSKLMDLLANYFAENGSGELAEVAETCKDLRYRLDELGKIQQTTTGNGTPFDPIKYWSEGMSVTSGLWYQCHDENGYIWEAIKDGIPQSDMDGEYFDIIDV